MSLLFMSYVYCILHRDLTFALTTTLAILHMATKHNIEDVALNPKTTNKEYKVLKSLRNSKGCIITQLVMKR